MLCAMVNMHQVVTRHMEILCTGKMTPLGFSTGTRLMLGTIAGLCHCVNMHRLTTSQTLVSSEDVSSKEVWPHQA